MQTVSWTFVEKGFIRHYPTPVPKKMGWVRIAVCVFVLLFPFIFGSFEFFPPAIINGAAVVFFAGVFAYLFAFQVKSTLPRRLQFTISETGISVEGDSLHISHPYSSLEDFRISRKSDPPKLIIRLKDGLWPSGMPPWYEVPLVDQDPDGIRALLAGFLPESTTPPVVQMSKDARLFFSTIAIVIVIGFCLPYFLWLLIGLIREIFS